MVTKKTNAKKKSAKKSSPKKVSSKKTTKAKTQGSKYLGSPNAQAVFVEEKKEKKTSGTIILLIAILGVLAIFFGFILVPQLFTKEDKEMNYNGFLFELTEDNFWKVSVAINNVPYGIIFHYHPSELEDIQVQEGSTDPINNMAKLVAQGLPAEIYLTMDPKGEGAFVMAGVEIAKVTGEKFGMYNIPTKAAFSKPLETGVGEVPVVTCNDADQDTVVIWIKEKGDNLIAYPKENCIVLQGTTANETVRVADRFIYELFGIM